MERLFTAIIKKRGLVLIIAAVALVASVISLTQTNLNSDVARYLPDDSTSKQTIGILRDNFNINGDAVICAEGTWENFDELASLADEIAALDEVHELQWLGSYKDMFVFENGEIVSSNPMLPDENVRKLTKDMFFEYEGKSYYIMTVSLTAANATAEAGEALNLIDGIISRYSLPYDLGGNAVQSNDMLESAMGEVPKFVITAFVVILIILLATSPSVVSAFIFLITIGVSILFNLGTNFFTKDISTITFSVAAILQLALSMDYSIFLTHTFESSRKTMDDEAAMVYSLKKTLTVIAASALTTIAGFCALFFMRYTMGFDLGLCLAKGVAFSFLSVIFVQPCLMLALRRACDKTTHKYLNPTFKHMSRLPRKLAVAAPVIVLLLVIPAFFLGSGVDYYYLDSGFDSEASGPQAAAQSVGNQSIFVTETVSAEKQLELAEKLKRLDGVTSVTGYYSLIQDITGGLSIPVYSSLTEQNEDTLMFNIEPTTSQIIALAGGDSSALEKTIESKLTVYLAKSMSDGSTQEEIQARVPELTELISAQLSGLEEQLGGFTEQFDQYKDRFFADIDGTEYTFFTVNINGMPEGDEAIETLDSAAYTVKYVLDTENVYISGNSQTVSDLQQTTGRDFAIISIVSAIIIFIILMFTFKDPLVSILLILVIELAIFLNLSASRIMGTSLNFVSYIIISAIQLGATIDYAILMAKNFHTELENHKTYDAIARAVNASAFPITVSVSILCGACLSVYFISSDTIIREITMLIARGALISGLIVLLLLPAILAAITGRKIPDRLTTKDK